MIDTYETSAPMEIAARPPLAFVEGRGSWPTMSPVTITFDPPRADCDRVHGWLGREVFERFGVLAVPQRSMQRHNPHVHAQQAQSGAPDRTTL